MKKYTVVAYEDGDGLPRKGATIKAESLQQAQTEAWRMFPEYHEIGVFEVVPPRPTRAKQKILVACEESQAVTKELRRLGHEAYSCDIIDQSGGHPEWHIMQDVLPLLNGRCTFQTTGGKIHEIMDKWDMIIAFPPCTHLAVSGARHFEKKRADGRQRWGVEFFCAFLVADCDRIAIENPVGIISGDYVAQWFPDLAETYQLPRKPSQIIHPWMFGDNFPKSTCLWLKGLKTLVPVVTTAPEMEWVEWVDKKTGRRKRQAKWCTDALSLPADERAKVRSKTFPGIAKAMAEQWAGPAEEGVEPWML